jgi:parallel beta-helix repeat protein
MLPTKALRGHGTPARRRTTAALTLLGLPVAFTGLIALPAQAAGAGYYVDRTTASCSDTGSGTATAPFCTIAKGVAKLTAGDTLNIGNGTYAETIKPAVSGTASAPITITAWPGKNPQVGTGVANGVYLSGRSYITISNLLVAGTSGPGIYVSGGDYDSVLGNEVTKAGKPAQGAIAQGIRISNSANDLVQGNYTHDNSDHGIYLSGSTTNTTVAYNTSTYNAEGYRRNANGINVVAPGNTIIGNITHDNEDSGINFYPGGNNNLATLNVTYNNGDHGIDDYNVTGGRLIGNTVFHNCTTGINVEGTSGNYVVENNIAVDNAVYPTYKGISCSRRTGNIGIWDSAPATTTVDHNLVWLTTSGTMYAWAGTRYTSLSAMQAASGQEKHGISADPKFVNASGGNLAIDAGSPAIDRGNSGVSGEQSTDIRHLSRVDDPGTPNTNAEGPRLYDDLGAYEFQGTSASTDQQPTAKLSVTPTTGTAPLAVTADAGASSDPQGQTLKYSFDFGDGTTTGPQAGATATHTYSTAGTYTVKVTVTDTSSLSASATQSVTATSSSTSSTPKYVNTVANNYSTSTHTSGYITVWRSAGVQAGDMVVLTLQLAGTSSGPVSATDSKGNTYSPVADVSDGSGNRLVLLSGVLSTSLVANDKITATFPSATSYRFGGAEFSGVTSLDADATATGAGSTFSTGAAPVSTGSDMAYAAVSVPVGTGSPTWSSGWTLAESQSVGSMYLSRAYQFPTGGSATGNGTATGGWLAAVATFR